MAREQAKHRGRGRRRRDGSRSDNQRNEILAAALALFSQQGYAATSMCSIARAVGLDQSSLYYWFSDKADILRTIMDSNRMSLRVASTMEAHPDHHPEQLYAVLYADVLMLCRLPFDFYLMESAAQQQPENFTEFAEDYATLAQHVGNIIEAGMEKGTFIACDPRREAFAALAFDEGIQHRFHVSPASAPADAMPAKADEDAGSSAVPTEPASADAATGIAPAARQATFSAADAADIAASSTVARLLAHGTVTEVRAHAHELGWIGGA